MDIEKQLRRIVTRSKETRYRIAKDAGIDYATLLRFLDHDSGLRGRSISALCNYFKLELVETKPKSKRKK